MCAIEHSSPPKAITQREQLSLQAQQRRQYRFILKLHVMNAAPSAPSDGLQADAFKKLYPREFLARFVADGIRPDGRPVGRCRPTTIGLHVISTADGSAMVKTGSTTALAGVKLVIITPSEQSPDQGRIETHVEMSAMAASSQRPGRFAEEAVSIQQRIQSCLEASCAVQLEDLCIDKRRAAWVAYLDVYILDAAGSTLDTAMLAAMAALASTKLPCVVINDQGKVVSAPKESQAPPNGLKLHLLPVAISCGTFSQKLIVDPTADEEALLDNSITVIVAGNGMLVSGNSRSSWIASQPATPT